MVKTSKKKHTKKKQVVYSNSMWFFKGSRIKTEKTTRIIHNKNSVCSEKRKRKKTITSITLRAETRTSITVIHFVEFFFQYFCKVNRHIKMSHTHLLSEILWNWMWFKTNKKKKQNISFVFQNPSPNPTVKKIAQN